ncbi:hypothetical protein SeMB42_g07640 [Synchytrium endobioticum]|uniref:Uncharacterized protein n=1 Tax=Synchytrium endobioticum TaxID=286115 RepID=A0A507C3V1_9FUNG|nr:hypothetical protein SeMB42_g07640 [Synchytrium endobioticum]TPX39103.1 hypothetical protein SeLEV6574_g07424 [Synchytrium endobioticum]
MSPSVFGKVAIVTGGASGFGKEISTRLVKQGAKVVIVDIQQSAGLHLEHELNAISNGACKFIEANVVSPDHMKHVFAVAASLYGRIDIVVPNAGIAQRIPFEQDDNDSWVAVIDVDLTGASLAGLYPQPPSPVYAAAKAGLVMLTRSLEHLKKQGIRVNTICPSFSPTPLLHAGDIHLPDSIKSRFVPVSLVVDAFEKAIKDESLAGAIIRVTPEFGIDIYKESRQKALSKF